MTNEKAIEAAITILSGPAMVPSAGSVVGVKGHLHRASVQAGKMGLPIQQGIIEAGRLVDQARAESPNAIPAVLISKARRKAVARRLGDSR